MLQEDKSIHGGNFDIIKLYGGLQNFSRAYTEAEIATKLADGLTGQLFKDVQLMVPKTPTEFLFKASKAIDLARRAHQRNHLYRDTVLPRDMRNLLEMVIGTTYQQKDRCGGKRVIIKSYQLPTKMFVKQKIGFQATAGITVVGLAKVIKVRQIIISLGRS